MDLIKPELDALRVNFNLETLIEFQAEHTIEIKCGADYQYYCYIDKVSCGVGLTPLYSLYHGIVQFKEHEKENQSPNI